jgi:drug/metabolite transporter (DMT)-like permease
MKIKTEVLPADQAESIVKAAELLRSGELVALPTETVYGIAADARNGEAVKKIFVAKGRPQDNPLIVHVTGPEMLPGLVSEVPERAQLLMAAFCPGPLTIIMPRGPEVAAECCALGLWQTTAQYAFYYIAVAMLTGAFGGILNSTQSFLGVIFAHFIYGNADRMTPAKTLGCAVGFAGVLIGTLGNHGSGSGWGVFCMMAATVIFTLSGPWNKSVTKKADSFAVCFINLFVGGLALFVLGTVLGGSLHVQSALAVVVMLYLAFICGAGYILWALLMKNNPVSRIAIFGFVNPVVNVLLSAVLNGEPLFRWQYLAALVFVCVGIWLVNKAPAQKEKV